MPPMAVTEHDTRHLLRAIELAERARGQTSPNPMVGAVVVKGGRVIGEGITQPPGQAHAERAALEDCSEDPAGATMYVSLEPCCHQGRTPPCTRGDPRRLDRARGDRLRRPHQEGLRPRARASCATRAWTSSGSTARSPPPRACSNQPFRKHARTGRPLVIFKSAMTLDGKVATVTGDSQWISGEASRARAHRWRAESDAVAVGIGTALIDDPRLTARIEGVARQPRRVVFDSEARLPVVVPARPRRRPTCR